MTPHFLKSLVFDMGQKVKASLEYNDLSSHVICFLLCKPEARKEVQWSQKYFKPKEGKLIVG